MKKFVYLISPTKINEKVFYKSLENVLKTKRVKFFQIRLKNLKDKKLINIGKKIKKITKKNGVKLIINDKPFIAKKINADALATGHYVKSVINKNNTDMYRGVDLNRDQSYFLFSTTKEQLNYLRFPLGNLQKAETRAIAKNLELNVADKPDSQDICFVPNGDYSSIIEKFRPNSFSKGNMQSVLISTGILPRESVS